MPVDFGILAQTPSIGARYAEGLQLAQAEQERNMLRAMQIQQMDMQKKNMLAQDEERKAMAQQRAQQALKLKADMDRAARNEKLLAGLSDVLEKNNYKLDRPTLGHMAKVSMQIGDDAGAKLAMAGLQALDEREALQAALGGQAAPAAPAAAPSMMRQPPAAAAPAAAPTNMFAGTPFDIGTTQPAPVNALAAPPQAPATAPPAPAGGVSRERLQAIILNPNAPKAAVERAKAALESMPKEPSVPSRIQEFSAFQKMTPEDQKAYLAHQVALQPKPAQLSVKLPEQEKVERGERGKLLVEQYKVVSDAARLATRTLPALETQERVLDAGFRTGFGAEAQKAGASLLAALGVPEAKDYATNAQAFSAAMSQAVLQKQLEQKGTQTKADADRIEQTGAQLTNTADANRFIINVARAQLRRDIAQRNFYDKWWKENKTYDGAEDAWATGEGNKSLFEDPALKKFAPAPAKPAPAAAPAATGSWRVVR